MLGDGMEHQKAQTLHGNKVPSLRGPLPDLIAPDLTCYLSEVLMSTDRSLIWSRTTDYFRRCGFGDILYGYSPDSHGANLGSTEDCIVLSTLGQEIVTELANEGYFLESTTFHYALKTPGIAPFSMTCEECGFDADWRPSAAAADFFRRHGMLTGCSIGFPPERTRGRAVMTLLAPPDMSQACIDSVIKTRHNEILSVAAVAHRLLSSLPNPASGRTLTRRQREVLEWVAEGKTLADIALIMDIKVATVEKHLRLAREMLGVETTAHALIKAAFLNQVFVVGDVPREISPARST